MTTDTCINYQAIYQPHVGEHVAWGDTGTVIYANSVLGARTNFESGPAALSAALTGRTPEYGFHLDANRSSNLDVRVEATLDDLSDWGILGKLIGERRQSYESVPMITGIEGTPSSDQLKHLGASLASHGSMGMFHIPGITVEAEGSDTGASNAEVITSEDIQDVYERYLPKDDTANLVVFSAPHLSLFELRSLAGMLEGKRVAEDTTLIVTTNRGFKTNAWSLGYLKSIEQAGGMVLEGVCFYILDDVGKMRERNGWRNIVTNSAKLANIIGAHKYNPVLLTMEQCVEAALSCTVGKSSEASKHRVRS